MTKVETISRAAWAAFVEDCPKATFFHTPQWYEVWKRYAAYEPVARLITLDSGRQVLLPLARTTALKGLIHYYHSSPAGTYGGLLTKTTLSDLEYQQLEDFLPKLKNFQLVGNPLAKERSTHRRPVLFTQWIDLHQPWESILNGMKKAQIQRKVRVAEREGLRLGQLKEEEVVDYFQLYAERRKEWPVASNNFSIELFRLLFKQKGVAFWGVYQGQQLIAAGPFLSTQHHVSSWLAIARSTHFKCHPLEFLYFHLIKKYRDRGVHYFDFNPSGANEGVVKFKSGFGATKIAVPVYSRQSKSVTFVYQIIDQIKKWC